MSEEIGGTTNEQFRAGVPAHSSAPPVGCLACHGAGGVGGVYNANAQTGGMINGVRVVAENYTKEDLSKKILTGVPIVPKADPNGPNPPQW